MIEDLRQQASEKESLKGTEARIDANGRLPPFESIKLLDSQHGASIKDQSQQASEKESLKGTEARSFTLTRPNMTFAVNQVLLFPSPPSPCPLARISASLYKGGTDLKAFYESFYSHSESTDSVLSNCFIHSVLEDYQKVDVNREGLDKDKLDRPKYATGKGWGSYARET
ncbi:hypothetical protein Tco_0018543 [Tanacetum coccineum]